MTPTMCFLCCAVTVLSVISCRAQLTPLLVPLSALQAPIKPGLLGAPARAAATTTALNVLSQGAKISKVPVVGKPLGLAAAAKAATKVAALPVSSPLNPLKTPKVKSALLKSKIPKKSSSVRLRSIDDEEGAEYLESLRSDEQNGNQNSELNPDSSNVNLNDNSPDHLFKPRSPDEIESVDELDYLAKAANPGDGSESGLKSFVHKVEQGLANTFKNVDETIRPHSKQFGVENDISKPYVSNNQNEDRIMIDNKAMEEYVRALNNEHGLMINYPYTSENIESVRSAMNQFQQRLSSMRSKSDDEDALSKLTNNEANTIEDIQKLLSLYTNDKSPSAEKPTENYSIADSRSDKQDMDYPYFISTNGLGYNPEYDGIWNPYNEPISKMGNTFMGNGYSYDQYPSPYESGLYQSAQVPSKSEIYKRDTPSEDDATNSAAPTLKRNSRQMSQFGMQGMPAAGIVNSALGLSQGIMGGDYDKISQAGVNLGSGIASTATGGHPQQMSPMSFGGMPAGGIVNSALDLSQGIMRGDYDKISQAGVNLGTGIATGHSNPEFFRNSSPKSQNLWNSANGFADSITSAAKNPNNMGTDQVLGSVGNIWNSANNLAGNIGKSTSGNLKNSPLSSLMGNRFASGAQQQAGNIFNSATDLASSITKVATNPSQVYSAASNPLGNLSKDRPIGSIFNSANNLAQSIGKPATSLGNQAQQGAINQLMKMNAAAKQATGTAGKLANSALNTGNSGLNQLLGSVGNSYPGSAKSGIDLAKQIVGAATGQPMNYLGHPTYAGGFYPRDMSHADNIWNSANALAGSIYNNGYPSMAGHQDPSSFYNPSMWGSATNLAHDITNAAMQNRMGEMPYYFY